MPEKTLPDLAGKRLDELKFAAATSTLDAVMKRLFGQAKRDLVTVSAFGSAL